MKTNSKLLSFLEADKRADALEALLREMNITIQQGGALEDLLLTLKELADFHAGKLTPTRGQDLRAKFRNSLGVLHLMDLLLNNSKHPTLPSFAPHIQLLNSGTPLQNTPAPRNDPSANKTLELLMGLAALGAGATNVDLDDPHNPKGDNPDVLADFDGEVWGFACKVPEGDAPATLYERIEDGIDQIERSRATRGFVVLNFKNRYDHAAAMPTLGKDADGDVLIGTYRDVQSASDKLRAFGEERLVSMTNHATVEKVAELFAGKKAVPGCLIIAQTTIGLKLPPDVAPAGLRGAPVITHLGFVHLVQMEYQNVIYESRYDAKVWFFLDKLNKALSTGLQRP